MGDIYEELFHNIDKLKETDPKLYDEVMKRKNYFDKRRKREEIGNIFWGAVDMMEKEQKKNTEKK